MVFNFRLGDREYSMDLSPELRVAIARHLIALHKEYCAANPKENLDLDAYLALVEKSPHPENESTNAPPIIDGTLDDSNESELIACGAEIESVRRKDLMIDVLLEAIAKLR
jgi:hypothetical protein